MLYLIFKKHKIMSYPKKYPEKNGWFVYIHKTPDDYYYVGMCQREPWKRWNPSLYKKSPLFYNKILECGWENIEHLFLLNGLNYQQAETIENELILLYKKLGKSLNKKNSGGWTKDIQKKTLYQKNYDLKRYSSPEGKIYDRVKTYNRNHTQIETPLEAKNKYLKWGYIPSYIKNNDLITIQ